MLKWPGVAAERCRLLLPRDRAGGISRDARIQRGLKPTFIFEPYAALKRRSSTSRLAERFDLHPIIARLSAALHTTHRSAKRARLKAAPFQKLRLPYCGSGCWGGCAGGTAAPGRPGG